MYKPAKQVKSNNTFLREIFYLCFLSFIQKTALDSRHGLQMASIQNKVAIRAENILRHNQILFHGKYHAQRE